MIGFLVYVDTSALCAILFDSDAQHQAAARFWAESISTRQLLVTTNYVLLETHALLQRRLGMGPVQDLESGIVPALGIHWVDSALHDRAVAAVLGANRRDLSLVDCVGFEVMRRLGIREVFSFDQHFSEQGFERVP